MKIKIKAKSKAKPADSTPGRENAEHKKAAFLRAYRKLGGKALAAEAIGVDSGTVWRWEKADAGFREAVLAAVELDTEQLEQEARRRAMEKDSLLMMFLLKGRRPEAYRDNARVQVAGDGEQPLVVRVVEYGKRVAP